jgi:hypothetical protein
MPLASDTKICLYVRRTWTIYSANVDEDARAIALVPVSAMIVIIVVLVVMVLPVPKTILIIVPMMSAPIIRP